MTEPSVYGGDAAFCQITLTTCYYYYYLNYYYHFYYTTNLSQR